MRFYLETVEKLLEIRKTGADSIEMETAAVFCVSALKNMDCSALHIVSDIFDGIKMISGFSRKRFSKPMQEFS